MFGMSISEIRQKNLRKILDAAISSGSSKNDADFCSKHDLNPSYISQMLNGHRSIGEKSARNIERKIGLLDKTLDEEQPQQLSPQASNRHSEQLNSFDLNKVPLIACDQIVSWLNWHSTSKATDDVCPIKIIEWLYTDVTISDMAFIFDIQDDAMASQYLVGHRVLIEPEINPVPADDVCAYVEGEGIVFRRYRKLNAKGDFELQALNELYATYRSTDVEIKVLGVMIEHRIYRKTR